MTSTSSRTLALLSLLQTQRDWPGHELAGRLDVSARTVRRDVDRLRDMGYRIRALKGPYGGYRLESGTELPPLLFDDEQAVALTVALLTASAVGMEEGVARALATLRQVLPTRLRHRVDLLTSTSADASGDGVRAPVDPTVLVAIGEAIRAREILRFVYRTGLDEPLDDAPRRRVEPHHLVRRAGRWYLVAWDLTRQDWRVFRVDRISPRIPTGPRFVPRTVPGGDVGAFVTSRFKGSDGVGSWPCVGEAVLAVPMEEVAPYVADGVVSPEPPDRCRIVTGSWSWIALAASLARFDADIEIVGPPELQVACRVLAGRFSDAAGSGV